MMQACGHERSHIVDSTFYGNSYSTSLSRSIFCDLCRLRRWAGVEIALAQAQAELGMIPERAAKAIESAASKALPARSIAEGIARTRHSMIALLDAIQDQCTDGAGDFLHFGATTQDIQDTAQSLELREVLNALEKDLQGLRALLVPLAKDHLSSVMVGRTHSMPALPTTFGLKVAGWIDELDRNLSRLDQLKPRLLVAQLFGGVGTMAAFGEKGPELLRCFAKKLSLGVPATSWHSSRDRIADYVSFLALVTGSLARVADEIRSLNRPEIGELECRWRPENIGSSTMPHKRNPEDCEQVLVLARLVRAQAGLALEGMVLEHERDYRGTRLEWSAVTDSSHYALAAARILQEILEGLRVNPERMRKNANALRDAICSEALVFELAKTKGKRAAFELVRELSQKSQDEGRPLRELLAGHADFAAMLSSGALDRVLDPAVHIGQAQWITENVLNRKPGE